MTKSVSPFAKLTCGEKQLKWLEYQSIRLPYVQASVDAEPLTKPRPPEEPKPAPAEDRPSRPTVPTPPPQPMQSPRMTYPPEYLKPRHRQYDAVIARMKQAEKRAMSYTSVQ